jgi:hypothetical protein
MKFNNHITLHFGKSHHDSDLNQILEFRSIERGVSIDVAVYDHFVLAFEGVIKKGVEKEFIAELLSIASNKTFKDAPSFNLGKFASQKEAIPILVLEGDTVLDAETEEIMQISDKIIDQAGAELEHVTGFEYLHFERLRKEIHEDI